MTSTLIHDETITQDVLALVKASGAQGITVAEMRDAVPANHHGTLSGILSMQHKYGVIDRLAEKRAGCKIYVFPEFTQGRATEQQGRDGALSPEQIDLFNRLQDALTYWSQVDSAGSRFGTDRTKAERNAPRFVSEMLSIWANR